MDEKPYPTEAVTGRDVLALCLALMTVAAVTLSMWSCGEDLTFPGQIPPTSTAANTATPAPTETPTP